VADTEANKTANIAAFQGGTSFLVVEKGALVIVKAKEDTPQPRIASLCLHDKSWFRSTYADLSSSTCVDPLKLVDIYIAPKNAGATAPKKETSADVANAGI
jgi:hypothetical protein